MPRLPITVVETPRFIRDADGLLSEESRHALIDFIAHHPNAGDLMPGTGGVRKLRWSLPGRGTRGGARAIYFFHNEAIPIFLITAFAKNEKVDLTQAEKNALKRLAAELVATYGKGDTGGR